MTFAPTPPLLAEAMRTGASPMSYLTGRRFGRWQVILVPLRLMPSRSASRVMLGTVYRDIFPDTLYDLRVRTVDGEPSWVFAFPAVGVWAA